MMLHFVSGVLAFSLMAQAAAPSADLLTADGLRAWLDSAGALECRYKLIHDQMQQQKADLPPWWPDDVYVQEEDAEVKVDFVDAALPFYQACMTDTQARLLAKLTASKAGQKVAQSSLKTHSQAALQGASASDAQTAGQHAADKTAANTSQQDRQEFVASLTPAERKMIAEQFSPAKIGPFRACTDKAYAGSAEVMKTRQEAAIKAVVEANHAELVAAKTKWVKDHPDTKP